MYELTEEFWEYNYIMQIFNIGNGRYSYLGYIPRKECCFKDDINLTEDERKKISEMAIKKLKTAIGLFELFGEGKINNVYYWDKEVANEIWR